jgi:aquaporin Z
MNQILLKKLMAEGLGTAWLVLGGCGSAVLAAAFPEVGIGLLGVSLAFGLTVVTMAYAIGPISGCHLNPAVTVGLMVAGKHQKSEVLPYIVAQFIGGIIGAGILYLIATGKTDASIGAFATNGYAEHSPGNYTALAGFITEFIATAFFLMVILGSTDKLAPSGFAPLSIGLCLTLIHLFTIPITNTSVNPARSLGPAVFIGGFALKQLWLFWIAPILGATAGAYVYKFIYAESEQNLEEKKRKPLEKIIHPPGSLGQGI